MLRRLFGRSATVTQTRDGFHTPMSGKELLATPRRRQMVKMLWDTTSLTQDVFDEYILAPIQQYAELVQLLPASESHHHAYPGGMLDHALEMACYGLRLRQRHLLPPNAKPEDQSSAGELWSAAVIYGSLMHDVAKTLVDIEIYLENGKEWRLWHGYVPGPYRVKYRPGREYHLHSAINPMLCEKVLGPRTLDWLMTQPKLFSQLMYTISGHTERGGIIAELVHQADRASVAKALGGDPVQALSAPVESIQRKLAEGLRYMVKEQFKLNQKGGVAWLTDEALWLVSPRAVNELKAHLYAQGIKSIPADLNRLYGELQAHGLIEEVSEGKSVWKCEISEGDWKQSFNMIKVPPTLIWGVEGKPTAFSGSIKIQGAGADEATTADEKSASTVNEKPSNEAAANADKQAQPESQAKGKEQGNTTQKQAVEAKPEVSASEATERDALDDDIMALFPELNNADKEPPLVNEPATQEQGIGSNQGSNTQADAMPAACKKQTTTPKNTNNNTEISNDADLGKQFWQWLKNGLNDHSIIINDTNAPVHMVDGTYFLVSPGIFKRFCLKVLKNEDQWKEVQNRFQKLGVHKKMNRQNIQSVSVQGPNKKSGVLRGYLIADPHSVSKKVPYDNWVLTLNK